MNPLLAEFLGTAILIIFGNGVVANVVLNKTKGNSSGWIVITFGWAMAVFIAVFFSSKFSGAHLNPAVTIGLAVAGKFPFASVLGYILAQVAGGVLGAALVYAHYKQHFDVTDDQGGILACFSTGPAIRSAAHNFFAEIFATFIFVFAIFHIIGPNSSLGSLDALPVALLVLGVGLSLGGNTGYAINPARDLGPRIAYALLPIRNKNSDWGYAWIPVIGPVLGGVLAAVLYNAVG
jgi:glycerol uptake facilitator protein